MRDKCVMSSLRRLLGDAVLSNRTTLNQLSGSKPQVDRRESRDCGLRSDDTDSSTGCSSRKASARESRWDLASGMVFSMGRPGGAVVSFLS